MTVRPGVSVRILRGLNGLTDSVTAFNDSDRVVGIQELGFAHHAFQWTAPANFQLLPVTTGWNSEAFGVNDNAIVAGDISTGPYLLPVNWPQSNGVQQMDVLNPGDSLLGQLPGCVARAINIYSVMAGDCYDPVSNDWFVVTWNAMGTVIQPPGDVRAHGYAINDRDAVVGGPYDDFWTTLNAYAYFPPQNVDSLPKAHLPTNPIVPDVAHAINAVGIITGAIWNGQNPANHPCVTDPGVWPSPYKKPIDIGPGLCGQASGIDNNNDVIGTVTAGGTQAFIWTQATGIQALPGLGGTNESSSAVAINNKREVLGSIVTGGIKYDVIWTF